MSSKQRYIILSGEGATEGTFEMTNPITEIGMKRLLTKERCGGDRWATSYTVMGVPAAEKDVVMLDSVRGDNMLPIDEELFRQICEDAGFDTDVMTLEELIAAIGK